MGRPELAAGLPLTFHFNKFMMFFPSRFSLLKSSEGLAPFVAPDQGFARFFSTDVVRPRASKWADTKERRPSQGS